MFLVIDIGNTNTVFAIYERLKSGFQLLKSFRIYSDIKRTPDEYSLIINQSFKFNNYNLKNIDGVAIASVVPEILNNIEIYFRNNLELPIFKVEADKLNIEINIQNPNEAGQDRLINAFAVKKMKFGLPLTIFLIALFSFGDKSFLIVIGDVFIISSTKRFFFEIEVNPLIMSTLLITPFNSFLEFKTKPNSKWLFMLSLK